MFHNGRKTIGVFIFRPAEAFQKKICQGITEEAKRFGYNVAFFSGFGQHLHNAKFVKGEQQIIDLPPYEELDGVILDMDSLNIDEMTESLIEEIRSRCHCPVVCLWQKVNGFHSIRVDSDAAIEDIMMHFIDVHEFTKVCFLAGPQTNPEGKKRLGCYKRVMQECGLPVGEREVFQGTFWMDCAAEACDHFFAEGYQPEAIVCANDYMALGLISELTRRGYRVPEDVCVSGFDGIPDTLLFSPSITTVEVPFFEIGQEAVRIISGYSEKKSTHVEDLLFSTQVRLNESCGCYTMQKQELFLNRIEFYEKSKEEGYRQTAETFMSINLQEVDSFAKFSECLKGYMQNISGYKSYYLCLCEGVLADIREGKVLEKYTEKMHLLVGFKERECMGEIDILFAKKELLPECVCDEEPHIFYFMPLHYKERCLGYQAVEFWDSKNAGNLYLPWIVNVENAIENMVVQMQMEDMITTLDNMSNHDFLTGLFNRRGLNRYGIPMCERAIQEKRPLFVMGIDLDGMKIINDNYGHDEGDNALLVVTKAICIAVSVNDVSARLGGDEFAVVGYGKSEEEVREFQKKFNECIEQYNQTSKKPYEIHASSGIYYDIPKRGMSLEACLQRGDREMYKNKALGKAKRGIVAD